MTRPTYDSTIETARDLLADGAHPEYTRGIVELIADTYEVAPFMDDAKARVAADLGVTLS